MQNETDFNPDPKQMRESTLTPEPREFTPSQLKAQSSSVVRYTAHPVTALTQFKCTPHTCLSLKTRRHRATQSLSPCRDARHPSTKTRQDRSPPPRVIITSHTSASIREKSHRASRGRSCKSARSPAPEDRLKSKGHGHRRSATSRFAAGRDHARKKQKKVV